PTHRCWVVLGEVGGCGLRLHDPDRRPSNCQECAPVGLPVCGPESVLHLLSCFELRSKDPLLQRFSGSDDCPVLPVRCLRHGSLSLVSLPPSPIGIFAGWVVGSLRLQWAGGRSGHSATSRRAPSTQSTRS